MKNLKEPPTISTENKSKILSKGNGITSIFERVFNRSIEESDKISATFGNGTEAELGEKISVYAEDHTSPFGTVEVVGTVRAQTQEEGGEEAVVADKDEIAMKDQFEGEAAEVAENSDVENMDENAMKDQFEGEPAEVAENSEVVEEVPQPALEAYPFQAGEGVEGPPYTYIPSKEDMETQNTVAESEYKNGDEFEHEVEVAQNGKEDHTDEVESQGEPFVFTREDLEKIESPSDFVKELKKQNPKPERFLKKLKYQETLEQLQVELAKLQRSVTKNGERVMVIFEGMDLCGKFGTIRKFTKLMDPRTVRVVSLRERSSDERDQWYFQRYMDHLPGKGEIVFFSRSWYERGFIDPIHNHCTDHEYGQFLSQTPDFEYMLCEHGVKIIKVWLAVSADELESRYAELDEDPMAHSSEGVFEKENAENFAEAAKYRNIMFSWTDKSFAPWTIISADKKKSMHIQSMKHVLSSIDYEGKKDAKTSLAPDATVARRFHRSMIKEMD